METSARVVMAERRKRGAGCCCAHRGDKIRLVFATRRFSGRDFSFVPHFSRLLGPVFIRCWEEIPESLRDVEPRELSLPDATAS